MNEMIEGFATSESTERFAKNSSAHQENFRKIHDLTLSNIGVGTYLGDQNLETDINQKNAIKKSILSGVNVIDTAINYRAQKSERTVGKAVSELIDENKITREEIFISTKNGYVTNDGEIKEDFMQYIIREFGKTGIVKEGDISSQYNCMTVPFLEDQLNRSQKNLGLDCIDLMYLHNAVEGQPEMSHEEFISNLKKVFEFYETKRKDGVIKFYGMATWECFRAENNRPDFLSLTEVINLATQVAGESHGFRFIQLPYNLHYDQAYMKKNQPSNSSNMSILESALENNIGVFTSVPLMQGKLLEWIKNKKEFTHPLPSVNALQFIRSTPGVLSPLIGHKTVEHVNENLEVLKIPPYSKNEFGILISNLVS